jgi:hypothetical protein
MINNYRVAWDEKDGGDAKKAKIACYKAPLALRGWYDPPKEGSDIRESVRGGLSSS